jgi:hypothetical protein
MNEKLTILWCLLLGALQLRYCFVMSGQRRLTCQAALVYHWRDRMLCSAGATAVWYLGSASRGTPSPGSPQCITLPELPSTLRRAPSRSVCAAPIDYANSADQDPFLGRDVTARADSRYMGIQRGRRCSTFVRRSRFGLHAAGRIHRGQHRSFERDHRHSSASDQVAYVPPDKDRRAHAPSKGQHSAFVECSASDGLHVSLGLELSFHQRRLIRPVCRTFAFSGMPAVDLVRPAPVAVIIVSRFDFYFAAAINESLGRHSNLQYDREGILA